MYCSDSTFPAVAWTQKKHCVETQTKPTSEKKMCVEHVTKSRKGTKPPRALVKVVFWELKNGKKLRMLQEDADSPTPARDIKWQQHIGACRWAKDGRTRCRVGELHSVKPSMPWLGETKALFALALSLDFRRVKNGDQVFSKSFNVYYFYTDTKYFSTFP